MTALSIYIALAVIAFIIVVNFYFAFARCRASALILTFLAESLLLQNLHPDRRPAYITKKCLNNKKAIHWFIRPLSVWYIENRGIEIATAFLRYIVTDLRTDENIELVE